MQEQQEDWSCPGIEIRAIVRKVAMRQSGHFMIGYANINGLRIVLSGPYGGDGLTCIVPPEVFKKGIPLPNELYEAWCKGGGWNGPGREADMMRKWALASLDTLYNVPMQSKKKGKS